MASAGPWLTPEPYEAQARWFWWARSILPVLDELHETAGDADGGATLAFVGFPFSTLGLAAVGVVPPTFARSVVSFAAHGGYISPGRTVYPPDSASYAIWLMAEVHVSSTVAHLVLPEVMPPPGAAVEWEFSQGEWVGPATLAVGWAANCGFAGGVGSRRVTLCRVPAGSTILDEARTDLTTWSPLATIEDTLPWPLRLVDGLATAGDFRFRTTKIVTPDPVVVLGIRTPEHMSPLVPGPLPLFGQLGGFWMPPGNGAGPTAWDAYAARGQINTISVARVYQPPRYRFVYGRAPYTIRLGDAAGDVARFHTGGRYGL